MMVMVVVVMMVMMPVTADHDHRAASPVTVMMVVMMVMVELRELNRPLGRGHLLVHDFQDLSGIRNRLQQVRIGIGLQGVRSRRCRNGCGLGGRQGAESYRSQKSGDLLFHECLQRS